MVLDESFFLLLFRRVENQFLCVQIKFQLIMKVDFKLEKRYASIGPFYWIEIENVLIISEIFRAEIHWRCMYVCGFGASFRFDDYRYKSYLKHEKYKKMHLRIFQFLMQSRKTSSWFRSLRIVLCNETNTRSLSIQKRLIFNTKLCKLDHIEICQVKLI